VAPAANAHRRERELSHLPGSERIGGRADGDMYRSGHDKFARGSRAGGK
jgi:hypothetical protein